MCRIGFEPCLHPPPSVLKKPEDTSSLCWTSFEMASRDDESTSAKRRRQRAEAMGSVPTEQKYCLMDGCSNVMSGNDQHDVCLFCLGWQHAKNGFEAPDACSKCAGMDNYTRHRRLAKMEKALERAAPERRERDEYMHRPPRDPWPSHMLTGEGRRPGDIHSRLGAMPRGTATTAVTTRRPFAATSVGPYGTYGASASVIRPREARAMFDEDRGIPPWPRPTWGDRMDDECPLDEVSPSFHDYTDYSAINDYNSEEEDIFPAYDPESYVEDLEEGEYPRQPAGGGEPAPAPAADAAGLYIAPEGAEEAPDTAAPAAALSKHDTELLELYKKAADRCNRGWPPAVPVRPTSSQCEWQGKKTELSQPPGRHVLPFALGFRGVLTLPWSAPTVNEKVNQKSFSLDTEMPATAGLAGIPPISREMAGYLINPVRPHYFPHTGPVNFLDDGNKKASAANKKLYGHLVTQAKGLNAGALLQGSLDELLTASDTLDKDQVEEARRLIDEIITLNRSVTEATGRAMTATIIQERTRWLDVYPTTGLIRSMLLDRPIKGTDEAGNEDPNIPPQGLFHGGMKELIAKGEESRRNAEAMNQLREPARRPPPPPPPQPSRTTGGRGYRTNWRLRSERGRTHTATQEEAPPGRGRGRAQRLENRRDDHPPPRGASSSRRGRGRGKGRGK